MNSPFQILIVDDERPARDKLRRLLSEHLPAAQLREARDGAEAMKILGEQQCDAVFLDIHMPEIDGIQVAQQMRQPAPEIVFVTAYDQFALQAFDANAIDYLLKPYDEARFLRALNRLNEKLLARQKSQTPARAETTLLISDRGVVKVIPIADILWVETADNYVLIHTSSGHHIMRQTLAAMAERLGAAYTRCHRRYLLRLDQVDKFVASGKGDGEFILHNGASIPCSRQYRDEVLQKLA